MKYQPAPSPLHLNKPQKEGTKIGLNRRYSLPHWLISSAEGGGVREHKQASGLPDCHLTHEFKTL